MCHVVMFDIVVVCVICVRIAIMVTCVMLGLFVIFVIGLHLS